MNSQPDQPNIYQQAAAELRSTASEIEASVTIHGAGMQIVHEFRGTNEDRKKIASLRKIAWSLETSAAARAETIARLQAALDLSRAENNR
ncbi:MAG: hypothetical protein IBX58_14465, partial [Roseovarius sp.]|nr:hypothetical protein [Roseovarius sp.]